MEVAQPVINDRRHRLSSPVRSSLEGLVEGSIGFLEFGLSLAAGLGLGSASKTLRVQLGLGLVSALHSVMLGQLEAFDGAVLPSDGDTCGHSQ